MELVDDQCPEKEDQEPPLTMTLSPADMEPTRPPLVDFRTRVEAKEVSNDATQPRELGPVHHNPTRWGSGPKAKPKGRSGGGGTVKSIPSSNRRSKPPPKANLKPNHRPKIKTLNNLSKQSPKPPAHTKSTIISKSNHVQPGKKLKPKKL